MSSPRRRLDARTVFLSDLHLGSPNCHAEALVDFALAHALDGQRLLALLLQSDQRGLEDFRRCLAETAASFAMKIDRR